MEGRDTQLHMSPVLIWRALPAFLIGCTATGDAGLDLFADGFVPLEVVGEDFAFTGDGRLVTVDAMSGVVELTRDGDAGIVAPYSSDEVAGLALLPGGGLVFCDEALGALVQIGEDGAQTVLASGLNNPNSVAVAADQTLYFTAFDALLRLAPESAVVETVLVAPGADLDGLTFDPGFRSLWFNHDETGQVHRVDVSAFSGTELQSERVASIDTDYGGELDGMTTDVDGNVYVVQVDGVVRRINAAGGLELIADLDIPGIFTSAIRFGSGSGGWPRDHLFVLDRDGSGVHEIDIGIDGAPLPHLQPPNPS